MKITTKRFANLDVDEDRIILMQRGILGFECYKRFVLLTPPDSGSLIWLQAVDDPALAFVVANPYVINGDYKPFIMDHELKSLEIERGEDIVLLSIVTVHTRPFQLTANLRAPLLLNAANRKANQIVLEESAYPIQYKVFDDDAKTTGDVSLPEAGMEQLDKISVAMMVV